VCVCVCVCVRACARALTGLDAAVAQLRLGEVVRVVRGGRALRRPNRRSCSPAARVRTPQCQPSRTRASFVVSIHTLWHNVSLIVSVDVSQRTADRAGTQPRALSTVPGLDSGAAARRMERGGRGANGGVWRGASRTCVGSRRRCRGDARRAVIRDLLVGPVNDGVGAAEPRHIVGLGALVEARHPGEAGDVELLADLLEDARVEPAEADQGAVLLYGGARRLEQLGRE
jgi:hypothetical protein